MKCVWIPPPMCFKYARKFQSLIERASAQGCTHIVFSPSHISWKINFFGKYKLQVNHSQKTKIRDTRQRQSAFISQSFLQRSHDNGFISKGEKKEGFMYTTTTKTQRHWRHYKLTFHCCYALSLLLPSQLRTESPLQFPDYLLIWNGFSRFILLYHLWFLIDQLKNKESQSILLHLKMCM